MKRFFRRKWIITYVIIIIVVLLSYGLSKRGGTAASVVTDTVKQQDLKQTVLATGQVTSSTNLNLSFKSSGITNSVNVQVGSAVKQGQLLASLSGSDAAASITQARGSLASAEANYQKVLAGASNEDVQVAQKAVDAAQVALDNAKNNLSSTRDQQTVLVANAYSALLNTGIMASPKAGNLGSATVTVSGAYTGTQQGSYTINVYIIGSGPRFSYSGLESGDGDVKSIPTPMGALGLDIQFSGTVFNGDSWTVSIPNTLSSSYVTNYNAYQAALKARDSAIAAAQNAGICNSPTSRSKLSTTRRATVAGAVIGNSKFFPKLCSVSTYPSR